MYARFYSKDSQICFHLKDSYDVTKDTIDDISKLKTIVKEDDLTDFLFLSDEGSRAFQLKAFHGETDIDALFNFINKKLRHYAYDLGSVNLLITMSSKGDFKGDFFQELHRRLSDIEIKGDGEILVSYNEESTFDVINTVYPTLGTTRIAHESFSGI